MVYISKRLKTIASYVPTGTDVVADIGTDHGYIPIYLVKNNIVNKCIACDINPNPLSCAVENIKKYNMQNQINTRLGSGITKLEVGESDVIIIAGMGGMLIIDILKERPEVVKSVGLLILQAQSDITSVRKYIHSISFNMVEEEMVYEEGKYYTIIVARPGYEKPYDNIEYIFGKRLLERKDKTLNGFVKSKIKDKENIKKKLENISTENSIKRYNEVNKELNIYREVLLCLQK